MGGNQGSRNICAFVVLSHTTHNPLLERKPSPAPPPQASMPAFENILQIDLKQFEKTVVFVYKLKYVFGFC